MTTIPWPAILDPARLQKLGALKILDTLPEQSYDDLAEIARVICDAPVANVTLVAEKRQWFKSHIGSDVAETPIEQSVCAHTIGEEGLLVINDMTDDARTCANALVTGTPALRFYAGVPLRLDEGFGVGTLCVLDTKPHPEGLTAVQIDALTALGRQTTMLLKMRLLLATRNEHGSDKVPAADPLEAIADALLIAYDINKKYDDAILEALLSNTLIHVGRRIAQASRPKPAYFH